MVLANSIWETTELKSTHVLLVDDDPVAERSMRRALETCGAKVASAQTVEAALELIEDSWPFDAAIVDYNLVDQNGLSIVRRLRSGQRPCCALMITGDPDLARGLEAIEAGADDFLFKPFEMKDLIAVVSKTVRQTRQWRTRLRGETIASSDANDIAGLPGYKVCVDELCRRGNLSMRERQVLEQILLGKKNRDAGAVIGVSERTVKYHMAGILKKIGVSSRNELMRLLFNH